MPVFSAAAHSSGNAGGASPLTLNVALAVSL
jgi:hypothetical protein